MTDFVLDEDYAGANEEPLREVGEASDGVEDWAAIDAQVSQQKIAEVAYLKAEARAFTPGYEMDDWLAAEAEIQGNYL